MCCLIFTVLVTIFQVTVRVTSQNVSLCLAPPSSLLLSQPLPPPPLFPNFLTIFAQSLKSITLSASTVGASSTSGSCRASCTDFTCFGDARCSNSTDIDGCLLGCVPSTPLATTLPMPPGLSTPSVAPPLASTSRPPSAPITTISWVGPQTPPPSSHSGASAPTPLSSLPTAYQPSVTSNETAVQTTTSLVAAPDVDVAVSSVNIIIIVVCVVGGCVLLLCVIIPVLYIRHRNKRRQQSPQNSDTEATTNVCLDPGADPAGARSLMDPLGLYRQSSRLPLIDDNMTPSPACFPADSTPFGVAGAEGTLTKNGKVKFLPSRENSFNSAVFTSESGKGRPESGGYSVKNGIFLEEEIESGKIHLDGIILGDVGESYSDATLVLGLDLSPKIAKQDSTIKSNFKFDGLDKKESFATLKRNLHDTGAAKGVGGKNIVGEAGDGAIGDGFTNGGFASDEELVDDIEDVGGLSVVDKEVPYEANIKFQEWVDDEFDNLEEAIAEIGDAVSNSKAHFIDSGKNSIETKSSTSDNSAVDLEIPPSESTIPVNAGALTSPSDRTLYTPKVVPESSTRWERKSGVAVAASNSNVNKVAKSENYPTNSLQHPGKKTAEPLKSGSVSSPTTPVGDDLDRVAFSFPSPSSIKAQNRAMAVSTGNGTAPFGSRKQLSPSKSLNFVATPVLKSPHSFLPSPKLNGSSSPQKQSPKFQNKFSESNKSPVLIKSSSSPTKIFVATTTSPDLTPMTSLAQKRLVFAKGSGPNRAMSSTDDNSSPVIGAKDLGKDEFNESQAAAPVSARKALFEQPVVTNGAAKTSPGKQGGGVRNNLNKV